MYRIDLKYAGKAIASSVHETRQSVDHTLSAVLAFGAGANPTLFPWQIMETDRQTGWPTQLGDGWESTIEVSEVRDDD
jgi:hypothetical protein